MNRHRLGLIGAGAWGLNHVRVLAADPRCELVAIADPSAEAGVRAAVLAPTARVLASAEELLADDSIEAVVIATPAPSHAALTCAALVAGKHVLVEKPLALSTDEVAQIAATAARSDHLLAVGHLMVFHPAVVRMRELLRSGELGKLHYVHSIRANLGRLRPDENALWSFGPHELSMLDLLLGETPTSVTARGQCVLQREIEDVVFLTLRYRSGEMAHLHLSWLHPRKERRFTIVCSTKMVEFDDVAPEKLRIFDKGYDRPPNFTQFGEYLTIRDGAVMIPKLEMGEPLRLQLAHFIDCIEQGVRPVTDLASATRIIRTLEAAQQSLKCDGTPVTIDS